MITSEMEDFMREEWIAGIPHEIRRKGSPERKVVTRDWRVGRPPYGQKKQTMTDEILKALASKPMRVSDVARAIGAHRSCVSARLKDLRQQGRVTRDGFIYEVAQ